MIKDINEIDSFKDEVKDINGVLRITIPAKIAEFNGIKAGDVIKAWITLVKKADDKQNEVIEDENKHLN